MVYFSFHKKQKEKYALNYLDFFIIFYRSDDSFVLEYKASFVGLAARAIFIMIRANHARIVANPSSQPPVDQALRRWDASSGYGYSFYKLKPREWDIRSYSRDFFFIGIEFSISMMIRAILLARM